MLFTYGVIFVVHSRILTLSSIAESLHLFECNPKRKVKKMKYNIKQQFPLELGKAIEIQSAFLIKTPYFKEYEREDIEQELLLFYLEHLQSRQTPVESGLIFISIKNQALKMLEKRKTQKSAGCKTDSLDEMMENGALFPSNALADFEDKIALNEVINQLNEKEKRMYTLILGGATLEEITKEMHISKHTIYKFFEKMQKNFIL